MAKQNSRVLARKIIVGAGPTYQQGWLSLTQSDLDITSPSAWRARFWPGTLDRILAEHVWEHLSLSEGLTAAALCYQYLRPGGKLRIAVPDGFHPDPRYRDFVRPGGWWNGADHKVLYDWELLNQILHRAGFEAVDLIEWWTGCGDFMRGPLLWSDGWVRRSVRDIYSALTSLLVGARYTSLIIDGIKKPR